MTKGKKLKLGKIDPDTGEAIPHTPEEEAEALEALRGIFNGNMKLEFAPGALEDLKRMDMTEDEILAMLADNLDAKQ